MTARSERRPTSRDVAARAGVSQSTVSLVLSGNPRARISEPTRARVFEAARELGYRPNLLARALVQRRSFALGIIVSDLSNPFLVEVLVGAEGIAAKAGYGVLLAHVGEVPAVEHLRGLRERQVDGILVIGFSEGAVPRRTKARTQTIVVEIPKKLRTGRQPLTASGSNEARALGVDAARRILLMIDDRGSTTQ